MGHGFFTRYIVTMASGATLTSSVDLGRAFPTVYIGMPANGATCNAYIKAAGSLTGTYRRLAHPVPNSSTVTQPQTFVIHSASSGYQVPLPNGQRFMKIETNSAVVDGCQFEIIAADD